MAYGSETPSEAITEAARTGAPVRLHLADGEVVVARILGHDGSHVVYAVVTSSRPEKYAVCDSTGFTVRLDDIDRASVLRDPSAPTKTPRKAGS
ncbi:MAG: hypothetical protein V3T14_11835 [Myxococcota bacterium]